MPSFESAPGLYARIGGLAYLVIIVLGLLGEAYVRGTLVVPGDGLATAARIGSSEDLWRAAIAGDLLMHVLDLPLIVLFYLLLRPVSRSLALLAALFNVVQTAVLAANKLTLLVPLLLVSGEASVAQLPPPVLGSLTRLAINMHGHGFGVGLIFFGFACLVRGYLMYTSGYFPRTIGVLLAVAGISYLVNSTALLLAPRLASALFPWVLAPALVGELALGLWLVVRGVDAKGWAMRTASVPPTAVRCA